ncbi:hypothetical protein LXL04_016312 [Taraxacum kok-saghyz]
MDLGRWRDVRESEKSGSFENSYIPKNPRTYSIFYISQTVIPFKKSTSGPLKTGKTTSYQVLSTVARGSIFESGRVRGSSCECKRVSRGSVSGGQVVSEQASEESGRWFRHIVEQLVFVAVMIDLN